MNDAQKNKQSEYYDRILADLDKYNAGELDYKDIAQYSDADVQAARAHGLAKTLSFYSNPTNSAKAS